jgi:hypothetical protein
MEERGVEGGIGDVKRVDLRVREKERERENGEPRKKGLTSATLRTRLNPHIFARARVCVCSHTRNRILSRTSDFPTHDGL